MRRLFLILLSFCGSVVYAQNPLVTHMFTADPTARVFDGKLYIEIGGKFLTDPHASRVLP